MAAQHYLTIDPSGIVTGTGYTPDGTMPEGAIECTAAQAVAWQGSKIVDGAIVAAAPAMPKAVSQVSMRQARLALLSIGKLAAVDAAIASLPSPHREAAQIEWDYSATVERSSTIVTTLGPLLNLDAAALDALFLQASTL